MYIGHKCMYYTHSSSMYSTTCTVIFARIHMCIDHSFSQETKGGSASLNPFPHQTNVFITPWRG